jgi:ribulose-phosphate 3-epimerase
MNHSTSRRGDHTILPKVRIAPSLLSANFAALGDALRMVTQAGADAIHIDVMDGHFVPNLTLGPPVIRALRPCSTLPFDVHLMITAPERYIEDMAHAGADTITIHAEGNPHVHRTLQHIRALGKHAGIALCPATPPESLGYVLDLVDLILVMTVNPGFGGQAFLASQIPKIHTIRGMIDASRRAITLEVDGGITPETAPQVIAAGADMLVAGSAVFQGEGSHTAYTARIAALRG